MTIKTYLRNLSAGQKKRFAEVAETSVQYLRNCYSGTHRPKTMALVLGFLKAGGGDLTLRDIDPDLFPKGKVGDERLATIKKACR